MINGYFSKLNNNIKKNNNNLSSIIKIIEQYSMKYFVCVLLKSFWFYELVYYLIYYLKLITRNYLSLKIINICKILYFYNQYGIRKKEQ